MNHEFHGNDANLGLKVSELNKQIQELIATCFQAELWVIGELQGFDRNTKEHFYFELVERRDDKITAKISAVLFGDDQRNIRAILASQSTGIELRDGLAVRARVQVRFYPGTGGMQVVVKDIDPGYTMGVLSLQRQQVLLKLEKEGIASNNLQRELPRCPLRVGLLTSNGSDAYNDVIEELRSSGFSFDVKVFNAVMQGPQMETSVLRALRQFYRLRHTIDVLLIVRGGGSRSDLAWFDSHAVGRAVCLTPIKIITGVGHHRDQCVLDFVAQSVKTPTAAAQVLVQAVSDFENSLDRLGQDVVRIAETRLQRATKRLDDRAQRIQNAANRQLWRAKGRLDHASQTVKICWDQRIKQENERLVGSSERLEKGACRGLATADRDLHHFEQRLSLSDPKSVLKRGYAILRVDGTIVSCAAHLQAGARARLTLVDGDIDVIVEGVSHGT